MTRLSVLFLSTAFLGACVSTSETSTTTAPPAAPKTPVAFTPFEAYMPSDRTTPCADDQFCQRLNRQQQQLQQRVPGVAVTRVDAHTLRLDIPCDVLFHIDRSDIRPEYYPTLSDIAHVLAEFPDAVIHVYGFTDSTASYAYNQGLSERRAHSVAHFLKNCGINPSRLLPAGYSESFPRSTNKTAKGRSLNRRVEILIRAKAPGVDAYRPLYGGQALK